MRFRRRVRSSRGELRGLSKGLTGMVYGRPGVGGPDRETVTPPVLPRPSNSVHPLRFPLNPFRRSSRRPPRPRRAPRIAVLPLNRLPASLLDLPLLSSSSKLPTRVGPPRPLLFVCTSSKCHLESPRLLWRRGDEAGVSILLWSSGSFGAKGVPTALETEPTLRRWESPRRSPLRRGDRRRVVETSGERTLQWEPRPRSE